MNEERRKREGKREEEGRPNISHASREREETKRRGKRGE
jgi:hypothetical protein